MELLIAVVMVSAMVISLALLFPKASASITTNRYHYVAANFAATRIQELKEQSYAAVPITAAGTAYFSSVAATPLTGCDCSTVNWTTLQGAVGPDALYTEDGVTYTRQVCVNLVNQVGGTLQSYCPNTPPAQLTRFPTFPNGPDFGLKNIRVHVSWTYKGNAYMVDTESQVAR